MKSTTTQQAINKAHGFIRSATTRFFSTYLENNALENINSEKVIEKNTPAANKYIKYIL